MGKARPQTWLRRESFELAVREAAIEGVSVGAWLDGAAREHVELERASRALVEREREAWGGWHPDDAPDAA